MSIEKLLQSHNELITAVQTSMTDAFRSMERNVASLASEVRELRSLFDNGASHGNSKGDSEAWSRHAEQLLQLNTQQHQGEIERMMQVIKLVDCKAEPASSAKISEDGQILPSSSQHISLNKQQLQKSGSKGFQKELSVTPKQEEQPLASSEEVSKSKETKQKVDRSKSVEESPIKQIVSVDVAKPALMFDSLKMFKPKKFEKGIVSNNGDTLKASNTVIDESKQETDEEEAEDFVPNATFVPVIPLPDLVEVKTGEEDENVSFVGRCKLYRFDKVAKENKERGVGEIKVLQNKSTGKYRVLMRRDQTLKICANFPIYTAMIIKKKDNYPTVYTWVCKDFSDDEHKDGLDEIFLARFKSVEIADEFRGSVEKAIKNTD